MRTSTVRRILCIPLVAVLCIATCVAAQEPARQPRSGDAWVDEQLEDINAYAARWPNTFTDELVRYHHAPRDLVETLLQAHWAPGDIYFACALAESVGRPCRAVTQDWEQHHADGWGALAQRLGVAPGSPAFQRIKSAVAASYDRWGRPLRPDDALRGEVHGRDAHAAPPGLPAPPEEDAAHRERPPSSKRSEPQHPSGRNGHGHAG